MKRKTDNEGHLEEKHHLLLFSTLGVGEHHICTYNTLIFTKKMQYGLRDEDFNYNHEMEDSSEGEDSMDEDVFED